MRRCVGCGMGRMVPRWTNEGRLEADCTECGAEFQFTRSAGSAFKWERKTYQEETHATQRRSVHHRGQKT